MTIKRPTGFPVAAAKHGVEAIEEAAREAVTINKCVFRHKKTKKYKWLSLESSDGTNRYLYESRTDTTEPPSQRPSDGDETSPASLKDYESAKVRICEEGYDVVTQL